MQKIFVSFVALTLISTIISCDEDNYRSRTKLEVYVTQNGEIPDQYELKIYRGDQLVKSDEFDREYRRDNNLTEVLDPIPGPYHFEAEAGDWKASKDVAIYDLDKVKIVNVELKK